MPSGGWLQAQLVMERKSGRSMRLIIGPNRNSSGMLGAIPAQGPLRGVLRFKKTQ
jgi:hypothetical protein